MSTDALSGLLYLHGSRQVQAACAKARACERLAAHDAEIASQRRDLDALEQARVVLWRAMQEAMTGRAFRERCGRDAVMRKSVLEMTWRLGEMADGRRKLEAAMDVQVAALARGRRKQEKIKEVQRRASSQKQRVLLESEAREVEESRYGR